MSLMDAMLNEGYRDPRDVYIALRTDGAKGSGTIDDPYDGGTRNGPPLSASLTLDRREVIVAIQAPHGYSTNTTIEISGVTGPSAGLFNRTHSIVVVTDHDFKITLDSVPTAPPSPTDDISCRRTSDTAKVGARLFWPVPKVITATSHGYVNYEVVTAAGAGNAAFNGDFIIIGAAGNAFWYRLRDNFDLPGSDASFVGLTCTKILHRFDEILRATPAHAIIRLGPGTFETRGLCSGYTSNFSVNPLALFVGWQAQAGQRLVGSGIGATVIKLVHAVDSVTQTTAVASFLQTDGFEAADFTVDCNLCGQPVPAGHFLAPVTCGAVRVAGRRIHLRRVRAIHFGPQAVPESFVLFVASPYADPSGAVHNVIEDCIVEQPSENNTHETTLVGSVGDIYANGRGNIVRRCFLDCPYANGSVSSEMVAVASLSAPTLVNGEYEFTLTTKRPHHRKVGNNIVISRVEWDPVPPGSPGLHPFNGSFAVKQWISATELKGKFPNPPTPFPGFKIRYAGIGVDFHGPASFNGTGCVTEGNAVHDCPHTYYTDTGSTRDAVVRDNYYSMVGIQAFRFLFEPDVAGSGVEVPARYAKIEAGYHSLRRDPNNHKIAIFESALPHKFRAGDAVDIFGALLGGDPADASYNGNYSVLAVVSDTEFTYEMKSIPIPDQDADLPTTADPIRFRSRWQVRRLVCEANICDLRPYDASSASVPGGMGTQGFRTGPPFMFPGAVFRENIFRLVDNTASQPVTIDGFNLNSWAFRLESFQDTLIEGNLVDLAHPHPIHYVHSQNTKGFNNQASSGASLRVAEDVQGSGGGLFRADDSLEDRVEDALTLALL